MDIAFISLLVITVLWYGRYLNNQYQAKKFIYRMYELRDKLRQLATLGLIQEDEMFYYFDRSFCRAIKGQRYLNIYTLLYVYWKHKNDPHVKRNELILRQYCKRHPSLQEIHNSYRKTLMRYIKGQHKFSYVLGNILLKLAVKTNTLTKFVSDAVKRFLIYPEFSESSNVNLRAIAHA
jgi:hypothetical protein